MDKEKDENSYHKININWYPGHMAKTKKQIAEDLKLIDIVLEVIDARIPVSSRNPDINTLVQGKSRILVLNKSDLSDTVQNEKWTSYFNKQGIPALLVNSNSGEGIQNVTKKIENMMRTEIQKHAQKGRIGRSIRIMVLRNP